MSTPDDWLERNQAEQQHVGEPGERQPQEHVLGVQVALEPVVGRALAITLDRCGFGGFGDVEKHAAPQHPVDAVHLRAVRVFRGLALGVVLAMHRHPLARAHAGGQPEPEAEEVARDGMQLERMVRLAAVQEDRHRDDGHVRERQRGSDVAPPREVEQAGKEAGHLDLLEGKAALNLGARGAAAPGD
jgi:hypothetical protein